jgi:hypothetical protein
MAQGGCVAPHCFLPPFSPFPMDSSHSFTFVTLVWAPAATPTLFPARNYAKNLIKKALKKELRKDPTSIGSFQPEHPFHQLLHL